MRYLSLFSGIEAATVAWSPLGWEPVGFAEIEPFPCAVLAHHYPDVPNLGSVTEITDERIAALGRIDVVVGGSPCQDLSVAGKRAGLAGERSSLFHEQIRIFNAARLLCGARWLIWENVPGALSSNKGRDFAVVVGSMAGCRLDVPEDGWGTEGMALGDHGLVEWCVLDAQWFGVAQRRRRVFAVLDTGNWADRFPVLLERDSLRGDSPPSREQGQKPAPCLSARSKGGGLGTDFELDGGLIPATGAVTLAVHGTQDPGTLVERAHALGRNNGLENAVATIAMESAYAFQPRISRNGRGDMGDVINALTAEAGETGKGDSAPCVATRTSVRRLTPRECERLQSFPDDYTAIPWRGKPADRCPDGPRYKALGNSMAVPVMRWIGERIDAAAELGNQPL